MQGISGFIVEGQRRYASWGGCVRWLEGDGLTSADALREAGLAFDVELVPLYAPSLTGDLRPIPGRHATRRTDNGHILGAGMTDVYRIVQNRDAFDFGDNLIGPDGPAHWVSAGSLGAGRLVYLQARLERDILIGGDESERIDPLLTIYNAHDGSGSFGCNITPVRVVCENTCRMAIGDTARSFKLRHTTNVATRVDEARRALRLAGAYYDALEQIGGRLIATPLPRPRLETFLADLFPLPIDADPDKDRAARNRIEARDAVRRILLTQPDLQNVNGTSWGAYQAVCDWADHVKRAANTKTATADENRLTRILFAEGKREGGEKDRALELLLAAA